jgi:hypothetical protein
MNTELASEPFCGLPLLIYQETLNRLCLKYHVRGRWVEEWALHELRMTLLIDEPLLVLDEIPVA